MLPKIREAAKRPFFSSPATKRSSLKKSNKNVVTKLEGGGKTLEAKKNFLKP